MKILMVSMPTLHFFRWTNQLQDSGHEVYWFDISGMSIKVDRLAWVNQKIDWKLKYHYPGRIFMKNRFPIIYKNIQKINERETAPVFEKYLNEIKPDIVHSFALYVSCTPIFDVMKKYQHQKWIYSSWGSDLFYFQNKSKYLEDIKKVLPRINYLFTDCKRDLEIAKKYGFEGRFLGVFPGGGGFDLNEIEKYNTPFEQRKIILVKGFQGRSGRAINILRAIEKLKIELSNFEVVIFGADIELSDYFYASDLSFWKNITIFSKISHSEVLELMGKSLIYIGNSNSDGIPNTLLEAICLGCFPIQSNPGGATAEVIQHQENGLLIEDCENSEEIKNLILKSFSLLNNNKIDASEYDFELIKKIVNQKYNLVDDTK